MLGVINLRMSWVLMPIVTNVISIKIHNISVVPVGTVLHKGCALVENTIEGGGSGVVDM